MPLRLAVTVTDKLAGTCLVVTVNCAHNDVPAGIVTVAGRGTILELLLERLTTNPPAGTTLSTVTWNVAGIPPCTDDAIACTERRTGGRTVRLADLVTPPADAEMVAAVL